MVIVLNVFDILLAVSDLNNNDIYLSKVTIASLFTPALTPGDIKWTSYLAYNPNKHFRKLLYNLLS